VAVPPRQVRRWQPPPPPPRRPVKKPVSPYAIPFVWWSRHPWIVLWVCVFLTPAAMLTLRLLDDTDSAGLVRPLLVAFVLAFVVALLTALLIGVRRSAPRALAGAAGAVVGVAILVIPMVHVIGQRFCPARMGEDRGIQTSAEMLEAWKSGNALPEVWASADVGADWKRRAADLALLDYQLVESGCWERMAPVTTTRTWHEFRVTVRRGETDPLSKILTVHTVAAGTGWRISEVEGPRP
jgi:hypothetical protein